MRCFTIRGQDDITPGLPLTATPYPHVAVGEEGRGRRMVRFPVGRQFAEQLLTPQACPKRGSYWPRYPADTAAPRCPLCGMGYNDQGGEAGVNPYYYIHPDTGECPPKAPSILAACVLRTRERNTLLLVEDRPGDTRALVLLGIPAGFRGGTEVTAATYDTVPCPHRGGIMIGAPCAVCGAAPVVSGAYYVHPDTGEVRNHHPLSSVGGVTVLAEGYSAQGDAGRMGGHAEYLLLMEPDARVRVQRSGRLYGAPAERIVAWDGAELHLGSPDEIDPPSEQAAEGRLL